MARDNEPKVDPLDKYRPTITRDKKTGELIGTEFPDGRKFFGLKPSDIENLTAAYLKGTGLGYAKEKETDEKIEVAEKEEKEEIKEAGQQVSDFGKEDKEKGTFGEWFEELGPDEPLKMKDVFPALEDTKVGEVDPVALGLTAGGAAAGIGTAAGKAIPKARAIGQADAVKILNKNKLSKFRRAFPTTVEDISKYGKEIITKRKGAFKFGKAEAFKTLGALYLINEFALNPSEIATWAAVDNIAGQAAFLTRDIVDAVKWDGMDIKEATAAFDNAEESIKNSKKFVSRTTMLNPKLWANRKILLLAIEQAEARIALSRMQLEIPEETGETEIETERTNV